MCCPGGQRDRLSVVAGSGGDNTLAIWFSLFKVGEINDTPAYFKGTRWRVIFMFDPNFATGMVSQQWPGVLLRRWYDFVNQICRGD